MGVVIFFVMAVIVAGVVAYPLLPGRAPAEPVPTMTDEDIERAVQNLRRARSQEGSVCPTCGTPYRSGDQFCVHCGAALANASEATSELECPSCGAVLRKDDRFCAKCGHDLAVEEVA
ncbi:MAG TPA: zinc ribbon domain-containing protein [Anaerolineae bacterium]|nr:zinc ribbon domain-containing protein [Anaerolineae bacterium]